ncbi:NUDIX domain-containing protein [Pseudalkalibacillus hwajinpoensis]|uniref:NUDIX domain-containing protein n=1 Tax=Guptibacillus hwajinpoensis TaxID=208199 RepID=UPI00325BE9AC
MGERGKVWLAAAGIVEADGKYLVVKKKYGGLKGKWSFPAGFVDPGETVDEAAMREVFEETGIRTKPISMVGLRSGVIQYDISDNLIVFNMEITGGILTSETAEIAETRFMSEEELLTDPDTSSMIPYFLKGTSQFETTMNPGDHFGYTTYKLFQNK